MLNDKIDYQMNKRGQIETLVGVVFLIGLVIAGAYSSSELLSEHRYIGDKSNNASYDLARCIISIEQENLVIFENKQEAENGYQLSTCS